MKLDTQLIVALFSANPTAEAVLLFMFYKERDFRNSILDIRRLRIALSKQGVAVNDKDLLELFRKLQDAQVGNIIKSPRGVVSQFQWKVKMKEVVSVAIGDRKVYRKKPIRLRALNRPSVVKTPQVALGLTRISFQTANGQMVNVSFDSVEKASQVLQSLLLKKA